MTNIIYGIDADAALTPVLVRDAIVNCFCEAHCVDAGLEGADKETDRLYCTETIKKAFAKVQADYDNPSKDDLIKVIDQLADFSKTFRDPETIARHYNQIMALINKL